MNDDIYREYGLEEIKCEDFIHAEWARSDRYTIWTHHIAHDLAPCSFCAYVAGHSCKKGHRILTINYNGYLLVQHRIKPREKEAED